MPNTRYWSTAYPGDNEDPWFEGFESFAQQIDTNLYGLLATAGSILIPPATITFNSLTSRMEWDADFVMPILGSGFLLNIRYGPDNTNRWIDLADGDKLVVTVPVTSSTNVNANFAKISSIVQPVAGLFIAGMRRGSKLYLNLPTEF